MECVAGRQAFGSGHDFLGALNIRCLYRKDLVIDSRQRIEGRLNGVASLDGHVAVENLLQYFGIGHQTHGVDDVTFQDALCVGLVEVGSPRWPLLCRRSPCARTGVCLRLGLKQFGGVVGIEGLRVQVPLSIMAIV